MTILCTMLVSYLEPWEKWLIRILLLKLAIMIFWSYYKASNAPISKIPKQESVTAEEYCEICNAWKPQRAHHCRQCKTCVLRYDHHCPWIGNCVGYHNYKYFVHFCFWAWVATTLYFYQTIRFSFYSNGASMKFGFLAKFCQYIANMFFCGIAISFIPMNMAIFLTMFNNLTHVESMIGTEKRLPCFWTSAQFRLSNKFNMLWLNNLA